MLLCDISWTKLPEKPVSSIRIVNLPKVDIKNGNACFNQQREVFKFIENKLGGVIDRCDVEMINQKSQAELTLNFKEQNE